MAQRARLRTIDQRAGTEEPRARRAHAVEYREPLEGVVQVPHRGHSGRQEHRKHRRIPDMRMQVDQPGEDRARTRVDHSRPARDPARLLRTRAPDLATLDHHDTPLEGRGAGAVDKPPLERERAAGILPQHGSVDGCGGGGGGGRGGLRGCGSGGGLGSDGDRSGQQRGRHRTNPGQHHRALLLASPSIACARKVTSCTAAYNADADERPPGGDERSRSRGQRSDHRWSSPKHHGSSPIHCSFLSASLDSLCFGSTASAASYCCRARSGLPWCS